MLILAADTSSNAGSLALAEAKDDAPLRVVVERSWDLAGGSARRAGAPNHSDRIVPEIQEMLGAAGVAYADLGGLACAIGPGSFTGLRVALSALKGIALAHDLPLAGVSTLEALAWNAPFANRRIVTMMDARKHEVYAAVFEAESGVVRRVQEDAVLPPDAFLEALPRETPYLFLGDARPAYESLVDAALGPFGTWLDGSAALPHAGNVARIGAVALRAGRTPATDAASVVPAYLRRPEAEWKRAGKPV